MCQHVYPPTREVVVVGQGWSVLLAVFRLETQFDVTFVSPTVGLGGARCKLSSTPALNGGANNNPALKGGANDNPGLERRCKRQPRS